MIKFRLIYDISPFEFVLAFFDYFLLLLLHFIFILEVSRIGKEPVFTAGQWGVKFKAFGFEIVKTKTSMFEAKVGSDRVGRSRSIGKRSSPGSIKMVCAPIDRRFIVDRSRSTISKRDGISVARRGGRRTSPSLSSSLLLTRRNFRHEGRREENFSSLSLLLAPSHATEFPSRGETGGELLLPLSPSRSLSRDGISVTRRDGRRTSPPSLSSSLPLTRRNFRHEERREENFSSLSLLLAPSHATECPSRGEAGGELLLPLSRFSLSLSSRRKFRREERREENFSFFVSLSLSLARPCVARGVLHHPLLSFRWRSPQRTKKRIKKDEKKNYRPKKELYLMDIYSFHVFLI